MIASLTSALTALQQQLAEHPDAVPVLTSEALEQQFHGLTVSQVAKLVDAPVLAQAVSDADDEMRRFLVDGTDEALKAKVARRLLLGGEAAGDWPVACKVILFDRGLPRETLVRDRTDTVYRVGSENAVIDEELTREARRASHRRHAPAPEAALPRGYGEPVTIVEGTRFSALLARLVRGLARIQDEQGVVASLRAQLDGGNGLPAAVGQLSHAVLADLLMRLLDHCARTAAAIADQQRTASAMMALLEEGGRRQAS